MAIGRCLFCAVYFVFLMQGIFASGPDIDISDLLNEFRQRIESLEARDAVKDAKIAELESEILFKDAKLAAMNSELCHLKLRMDEVDTSRQIKEASLQDKIDQLEKTLTQSTEDFKAEQQTDSVMSEDHQSSTANVIKQLKTTFRKDRAVPETEVAFYATHQSGKIHHLGVNQALQFQLEITDNGNAYNNNTGAFVAPVDGTYVFHATVMAIDTTATGHFRAHFDVDGTTYSVFFVTSYDQSSQMLVINLKQGQTVTIRNDYTDTGYYGAHHSTFLDFCCTNTNQLVPYLVNKMMKQLL